MKLFASLRGVVRGLLHRGAMDAEIEEELRAHIQSRADDLERAGLARAEAERRARLEFGGYQRYREESREALGPRFLEVLLQDVRLGARRLRKNPGSTLAVLVILALGIGANSAIFTLTYAVMLKSLPVPNPQELVRYAFRNGDMDLGLSGPLYDSLRKHETTCVDLLAWSNSDLAVEQNGEVRKVSGALMSGNGFRVLQLQPFLGRTFAEADDVPSGGPNGYQALVGYNYWKEQFAGRPDVLGRSLHVNGRAVTIVGVLPAGFEGVISGEHAELVLPLAFEEVLNHPETMRHAAGSFWLTVMGRLKPSETVRSAAANLEATQKAVREEADPQHTFLSGFFSAFGLSVESGRSGRSFLRVAYSRPLLALEILVALLLLLCCANAGLLVLAGVSARSREFAVRRALGAPRERILRQVVSEIGLLAVFGLAGSLALGWAGAKILVGMLAAIGEPPAMEAQPGGVVLAFTAAITVCSFLAAGLWPAIRASRISPLSGLKEGGNFTPPKNTGQWIIPAQVAVSLVLLAVAALMGSSLMHLLLEDSGFRAGNAVMAAVELPRPAAGAPPARYARQMSEELQHMPGIEAAAAMSLPPISPSWSAGHYYSLGRDGAVHRDMNTWPETVTAGYFAAMGTRILEGRTFEAADAGSEQVCVLSASAAQFFFPGEDAVGQHLYAGGQDEKADGKAKAGPNETYRVIGVAEDARFRSLREPPPRMLYVLERQGELTEFFHLAARGPSAGAAAAAIREVLRRNLPGSPLPPIFTFDQLVARNLSRERMLTALASCFAAIALLLTATGLYGLLARNVVLRTREIGLRRALGAGPRETLGLVVGQGFRLVVAGILAGLGMTLAAARLFAVFLYRVSPADPVILTGVAVVLFVVALAASSIPAWRAARVDPMNALRYE
jgi:predicted permease